MNAHEWLFGLLGEADVATLCGMDPTLLGAYATTRSEDAWLGAVIETIIGRRTYDRRIRSLLESDDRTGALELAASASVHGHTLSEDVIALVDRTWTRLRDDASARRARAAAGLDQQPVEGSELRELVDLWKTDLESTQIPSTRPTTPASLKQALVAIDRIETLATEAEALSADLERERERRGEKLRAATLDAAHKLAELLFHEDKERRATAADAMRALPVLVQDERLDALQAVADGELDAAARAVPRSTARKTPMLPARQPAIAAPVALSFALHRVTQSLIQGTGSSATTVSAVTTLDDVQRIRRNARSEPLGRRAQILLAGWRGAAVPGFANSMLGEGLLATAERYLFEDGNARLARFCASDAVAALVAAGDSYEPATAEEAVAVLLLCQLWPRLQGQVRRGSVDAAHLSRNIGKLVKWIDETGLLEVVGQVWASESLAVAREVHSVIAPFAANAPSLWTACAFALLRQELLLDSPEVALDKLFDLLKPTSPPPALYEALRRIAREFATADKGTIVAASRNAVLRDLGIVEAELAKLPAIASVPHDIVSERLPAVIRQLVDAPSADARPQISIARPLDAVFLSDRADEIRIPVVVENAPKAAAARDLHVQVSLEPDDSVMAEILEPREQPLPQLDPGESDERSFYCNIRRRPGGVARTEIKLTVTVRAGVETAAKATMPIALRDESRTDRKSPYQPGIALEGDEGFVGRERHRKLLTDALLSDAVRVPLVVGIRRVGKTSLLHAIRREPRIKARYVTKYLTLEARPSSDTSVAFLLYVAEALRELLEAAIGKVDAESVHFSREEFRGDPYAAFERFTSAIEQLAPKRALLLVLDEFDKLLAIVEDGKRREATGGAPLRPENVLQPEVFGALRAMIMRGRAIRVMIAGLPRLLRRLGYEERFFGMLEPVRVAGFTEDEARHVIAFAQNTMQLTVPAQTRLLRASGGQPYLLQTICHELFNHMLGEGRNVVTRQDVDEVIEKNVLPYQTYFTDFVQLIDDRSSMIVKTIAKLQHDAPSRLYVTLSEIEAALAPEGIGGTDLRNRLAELTDEDRPLLERPQHQNRYRLTIGILADHLLRGT